MQGSSIIAKFIETEPISPQGKAGEQLVWRAIQAAFAARECLAYWRYPIFSQAGNPRKEPDIFIADLELGLIVIEVKSLVIQQIARINGHRWEYQNFYATYGNPYQQAESQLFALLEYTKNEPSLAGKIAGRVALALPLITRQQWQERGFTQLPTNPPILFQEDLSSSLVLWEKIGEIPPLITAEKLARDRWKLLLSVLSGTPVFCQPSRRVLASSQSRGSILQKLRSQLSEFDLQQEKVGKEIPPGPQRIRGIAGSGKTVILCQKAAQMYLKHPQWKIAFVFFSRSLYQPIVGQIDKWIRYFSNNQQQYDPKNGNLQVLHAWGSRQQPGFYRTMCKAAKSLPLSVDDTTGNSPSEALAQACIQLLKDAAIPQLFDAILIDEGQDLISDRYQFAGKQPFYWLAYQSLRPATPNFSQQKRLIWAYDEAQSLEALKIPTCGQIFGEELGNLVTGKYPGGIKKSEIMRRCYRTPHEIITAAHALAMGWLRPTGMLAGMTDADEWKSLGYEVEGRFVPGQKITIKRPRENSPNPLPELWQGKLIEFQVYSDRQQELTALAKQIKSDLRHDGLRPSGEILVIILGNFFEAVKLENYIANFLMKRGIDIFIPGNTHCNTIAPNSHDYNPNKFWCEGAVTISRIHRAKGQETDRLYLVGLDLLAKDESNLALRNQLFVALTRTRAWANLSGIGSYSLYSEIRNVLQSRDTFTFIFRRPPKREIGMTDVAEILTRYALGGRNFQNAELPGAELAGIHLNQANLIGANLSGANLENAQLAGVKLIAADLSYANLAGANMRNAKLIGANLQGANLLGADLTGTDFQDTNLTEANTDF